MRYSPTIFLLLWITAASGQIDTSKIKIAPKHYYAYAFGDRQCYTEGDSTEGDSVITDVKEITYPGIETDNRALMQFMNDTIRKIAGINDVAETRPRVWLYACSEDKPAEAYMDYKINFVNRRYLSLTITTDEYAGGGCNGSSHNQTALTFDLRRRKTMLLKDVIKEQYDRMVYHIAVAELKASSPGLFGEFGETDNPNLFHFTSTRDHPIAIEKDRIILYWEVNWGTHPGPEDIPIYFAKYANLFDKKFLKKVRKK